MPALALNGAAVFASEVGLGVPPLPLAGRLLSVGQRATLTDLLTRTLTLSSTRADLTTLAGVLELERGDTRAAAARFEAALELYATAQALALSRPGAELAARYHESLRGPR